MQCEIAVIGNGAVGKTTALGFAQAGYKVILVAPSIVAKTISPDWDSRVFALNHTAKNLLSKLKVWDALNLQRVAPVEAMHVVDGTGGTLDLDAYTVINRNWPGLLKTKI